MREYHTMGDPKERNVPPTGFYTLADFERSRTVNGYQELIAQQLTNEIIIPRRAIWAETLALLTQHPPERASFSYPTQRSDSYYRAGLHWQFPELISEGDNSYPISASISMQNIPLDIAPWPEDQRGLAILYVSGKDIFQYLPPSLLDVNSTGSFLNKQLSLKKVEQKLIEDALLHASTMTITGKMTLNDGKQPTFTYTLATFEFDSLEEKEKKGTRYKYLDPNNTEILYRALKQPNNIPTPEVTEQFLRTTYLEPGIGESFQTLSALNRLLHKITLTPQPPKRASTEVTPKHLRALKKQWQQRINNFAIYS